MTRQGTHVNIQLAAIGGLRRLDGQLDPHALPPAPVQALLNNGRHDLCHALAALLRRSPVQALLRRHDLRAATPALYERCADQALLGYRRRDLCDAPAALEGAERAR